MSAPAVWPDQFIVTYVPLPRVWCTLYEKSEQLASLDAAAVIAVQAAHRCGPRTAPWASRGLSR